MLLQPKFNIDSDLELRTVLEHLGLHDIFDPSKAKLSKMSSQPIYVSRVFHKAVIQVDEAGTVAAGKNQKHFEKKTLKSFFNSFILQPNFLAVAGGTLSFKQSPVEFVFDRPFGFLITDRTTHTLLFAGQVRHPLV